MAKLTIDSIEYMFAAHAGQTDKSGTPYYCHPRDVMLECLGDGLDEDETDAALMHA